MTDKPDCERCRRIKSAIEQGHSRDAAREARRDGTLLVSYRDMDIHGAINAARYFQAKAGDSNVGLGGCCGQIAMDIVRAGYQVLINFALSDFGMRIQFVSVDGQAGEQRSWGATLRRAP